MKFHPRRQGDLGEMSAMEWFESKGAGIYFPIGHSPHADFIAEFDDELVRVQVKTCTCFIDATTCSP
jgi:Holliday junction resolvase-like predicted endonuclease